MTTRPAWPDIAVLAVTKDSDWREGINDEQVKYITLRQAKIFSTILAKVNGR